LQSIYLSNVNQFGYKGLGPSKALEGRKENSNVADVQRREDGRAGEDAGVDEQLNAAKKKKKEAEPHWRKRVSLVRRVSF